MRVLDFSLEGLLVNPLHYISAQAKAPEEVIKHIEYVWQGLEEALEAIADGEAK